MFTNFDSTGEMKRHMEWKINNSKSNSLAGILDRWGWTLVLAVPRSELRDGE